MDGRALNKVHMSYVTLDAFKFRGQSTDMFVHFSFI